MTHTVWDLMSLLAMMGEGLSNKYIITLWVMNVTGQIIVVIMIRASSLSLLL